VCCLEDSVAEAVANEQDDIEDKERQEEEKDVSRKTNDNMHDYGFFSRNWKRVIPNWTRSPWLSFNRSAG
jgi:hypothetical protein